MKKLAEELENIAPQLNLQLPGTPGFQGLKDAPCAPCDLRMHSHRHREILLVLEGSGTYPVDNHWYDVSGNNAIFINSWQQHGCYSYELYKMNVRHIWFMLYPRRIVASYLVSSVEKNSVERHLLGPLPEPVCRILTAAWDRLRSGNPADHARHYQQLRRAFELVIDEISEDILSNPVNRKTGKTRDIAEFILEHIENRSGCGCSLDNLAKLTGYTACYISHLFRSKFNKTVGEAVNAARMRYVIEQTARGAGTKAIAGELEFASVESFWKWRRNNRALEESMLQLPENSPEC